MMPTIDEAAAELHQLGRSAGDCLVWTPVWMLYAHDGDRRVIAKAPSHTDAWHEAVLLFRRLAEDRWEFGTLSASRLDGCAFFVRHSDLSTE